MADSTAHVTWSGSLLEGGGTVDRRKRTEGMEMDLARPLPEEN